MSAWIQALGYLPELIKIFIAIYKSRQKERDQQKLKENLQKLEEAIRNGDDKKINDLFSNL